MTLLRFIAIGLIAGWILGVVRHGHGYGLIGNLGVGTIGSLIGWFLMGFLKIRAPTLFTQVAMAVLGAVLFFLVMGPFKWKSKKKRSTEENE